MMFSNTFYYLFNINIISQFFISYQYNNFYIYSIVRNPGLGVGWGGTGVCGPWKVIIFWKRGEYRGFKVCQLYINVKNKFE